MANSTTKAPVAKFGIRSVTVHINPTRASICTPLILCAQFNLTLWDLLVIYSINMMEWEESISIEVMLRLRSMVRHTFLFEHTTLGKR
jgi:hypothetical protein